MTVPACKAGNSTFPRKWGGWRESKENRIYVHSRIRYSDVFCRRAVWPVTALTSWLPRCSGAGERTRDHSVPGKPMFHALSFCDLTSGGFLMMDRAGVGRARLMAAGDSRLWWGFCLLPPPLQGSVGRSQLPPCSPSSLLLGWNGKHISVPYNQFLCMNQFCEFIVFMNNSF